MTSDVWTVRVDVADFGTWANEADIEDIRTFDRFLAHCREFAPPGFTELIEVDDDYRYLFWTGGIVIEFIAVTYERLMLITGID